MEGGKAPHIVCHMYLGMGSVFVVGTDELMFYGRSTQSGISSNHCTIALSIGWGW